MSILRRLYCIFYQFENTVDATSTCCSRIWCKAGLRNLFL